jgi:translation initiation factor 4G
MSVSADSPKMVDCKVKGLLDRLTMEEFDSISRQIIDWVNRSENESDGRTLIQVTRLVVDKATDELRRDRV